MLDSLPLNCHRIPFQIWCYVCRRAITRAEVHLRNERHDSGLESIDQAGGVQLFPFSCTDMSLSLGKGWIVLVLGLIQYAVQPGHDNLSCKGS